MNRRERIKAALWNRWSNSVIARNCTRAWLKDQLATFVFSAGLVLFGMLVASYKPLPLPQYVMTVNGEYRERDTRGEQALAQYVDQQWDKLGTCNAALWTQALDKAAPNTRSLGYEKRSPNYERVPFIAEATDPNNMFGTALVVGFRETTASQHNVGYYPTALLYGGSSCGGQFMIDLATHNDVVNMQDGIGRWREEHDATFRENMIALAHKTFVQKWLRDERERRTTRL